MKNSKAPAAADFRPKSTPIRLSLVALWAALSMAAPILAQENQTIFGPNVYVIGPATPSANIQADLLAACPGTCAFASNSASETNYMQGQFSTQRTAVLFLPGTYTGISSQVGFYEQVAGLGQSPSQVMISGNLYSSQTDTNGNVTTNFWRALENMEITYGSTLYWGVSQGAQLRRIQLNGSASLANASCGYASGGFIADMVITGNLGSCSQQQWFTRNSTLGTWSGGNWNMVFSGVQGAPVPNFPANSYTVVPSTPVSREKPYLYVDGSSNYFVFVPSPQTNSVGTTWYNSSTPGYSIPIANFFIATPSSALSDINYALALGQNLILTPGIYQYSGSINITNPNTIVLGLGYATLVPQTGSAAITVADVDGVEIGGLIIDAGPVSSPVLLQIGVNGAPRVSHRQNPITISDMTFRIGGATVGTAVEAMEIDSDNVILDNIWAWRADHGAGATPIWTGNAAQNGVVVNGDNVTALGLAVEHFEQTQTQWNGNGGETIFYQSEIPYDVPSQAAWMNGSANGYASYSVSSGVTSHTAYGVGVYSNFTQSLPIIEDNAITVPNLPNVTVTDAVSVFLSGSGQITSTIDNTGTVAKSGQTKSTVPFYQGAACATNCTQAPSNLEAWVISPTQINLTWTPSATSGAVYYVYRSTTAGFTPSITNQVASGVQLASFADAAVSPATTYYYAVEAAATSAGFSAATTSSSATTPSNSVSPITTHVIAVDSGATSGAPAPWVNDNYYGSSGSLGSNTHAVTLASGDYATASVYQAYRKTNTSVACTYNGVSYQICYAIPGFTPGNVYVVNLHFVDFTNSAGGARQFNVQINGQQVLTNFDIAGTVGQYVATIQSFYAIADSTGTINITFSNGKYNNPLINGIEIGTGAAQPPSMPTTPTSLSQTVSDNEVNLSWNASSGSNLQYEVFRSYMSGFVPSLSTLLTTTTSTQFTDTATYPGATYYYVVEANNAFWTTVASNQVSAVIPANATPATPTPVAPTGLIAGSPTTNQISLLWTGSATPNVEYDLYRGTTSNFTPASGTLVETSSATGYVDIGLTPGTTYYYLVEAANTAGNSPPSNAASTTTSELTQSSLIVTGVPATAQPYGSTFPVGTSGGNGTGAVTFATTGACAVSGTAVTMTAGAGTCSVTATKGTDGLYNATTSAPATVAATLAAQATLIVTGVPATAQPYGSTFAVGSSGGSGTGAVTFATTGACTISATTVTINAGSGTCAITATRAADSNYLAASSAAATIPIIKAAAAISINDIPSNAMYGGSFTPTLTYAGNGTTWVTSGTTGVCTVNAVSGLVSFVNGGSCSLTASATATANYASATGGAQTFTVANPLPVINSMSPAINNVGGAAFTLTVNGSEYIPGSIVFWGTLALPTQYVSATQLTASVSAADIAVAGTMNIAVQTPMPGGGTSNALQYAVEPAQSVSNPIPIITTATATVSAGTPASYPVSVPSTVANISVTCLNLPTGATCSYSSSSNSVTIATSSATPKGTYQVTVIFADTVTSATTSLVLLPVLLAPLMVMRKRLVARGLWMTACLGVIMLAGATLATGCGGLRSSTGTPQQLSSASMVSLTIQ
jgi:fibronectin type 3 domain-containing protein